MAAWPSGLGRALQRPVPQFDSGRRLQQNEGPADWPGLLCRLGHLQSEVQIIDCAKLIFMAGRRMRSPCTPMEDRCPA